MRDIVLIIDLLSNTDLNRPLRHVWSGGSRETLYSIVEIEFHYFVITANLEIELNLLARKS